MLFCSYVFILVFLPLLLFLYYIIKNRKYRNILLLIFSLIFYAWGEPKYILLLLISIVINYFIAIMLERINKNKKVLVIGVLVNILSIVIFKYLDFGILTINGLFDTNIKKFNLTIPIGISFYTFQSISYIIDVYRKKVKAEHNILNLGLYISLFPQLVAGPIVKYKDIYNDIIDRKETIDKFYNGIRRFMIGFAKKSIIANNMAVVCDTIYSQNVGNISMPTLWLAAISFTLQIYYDFSGYSDMAIGLGKMFGFNIPENFNYPYISTSISDFWKRWHISLTSWFREYVYIPLGGNKCSKIKWIRNIIIVFFLTGLWHGASYNFIIWGLYNALFIILEKTILKKFLSKLNNILKYLLTMLIIIIGFVIFRIENLSDLLNIIKGMFDISNIAFFDLYFSNYNLVMSSLYLPIGIIFVFPIFKLIKKKIKSKYDNIYNIISFLFIFIAYLYSLVLLINDSYNYFIYFKF